jgi:hypothetical protein
VRELTQARLRVHPELASLVVLAAQLEQLPTVLASIHDPERRDALSDQARSISRVSMILTDQVRAYVALALVDEAARGTPAPTHR